jgi:hypothetical protein
MPAGKGTWRDQQCSGARYTRAKYTNDETTIKYAIYTWVLSGSVADNKIALSFSNIKFISWDTVLIVNLNSC